MAAPNFQRIRPLVGETALQIANGGTTTAIFTLDCSPFIGLQVPVLDACTLQVSGCISAQSSGGAMLPIVDKNGLQVLTFPSTTGNFVIGTEAMEEALGCTHLQVSTSAAQSAARQFVLLQRVSL